jgi:hypothetical protein
VAGIGTNIFASTGLSASAGDGGNGDGSASLASATYGPPAAGSVSPFSPTHGVGLGFWLAVTGVVVLVFIRQSLPR